MTTQTLVIDYGIGNLHSVVKALSHEGAEVRVSSDPADLERAERVVLPGVGAFADGVRELISRRLFDGVRQHAERERPLLGICLGMQMLLSRSEEFGQHAGLDIVPGGVVRIPNRGDLKVPHVGWNRIEPSSGARWDGTILDVSDANPAVYFVHSFNAEPEREEHRLADTWYGGVRICAAVRRGSVVGCQFHPEKSGPVGLEMIRAFLTL